jgi:hypothetical protein
LFLADGLLDLGLAHAQHAPELLERRLVVEEVADLVQAEAEIPQRKQPVQASQLVRGVRAVARDGIHSFRLQQPDLVVVAQHPR